MKIANTAPYHLSNLEVLNHFLELKRDSDALKEAITLRKARVDAELKKRYPIASDEGAQVEEFGPQSEEEEQAEKMAERRGVSDDLIWVQDKVIEYLCSDLCPTSKQTEQGVSSLADGLQDHGLVKGEILQICNLAPVQQVELYCIIEEVDTRFAPDPQAKLSVIADQVRATLLASPPDHLLPFTTGGAAQQGPQGAYEDELLGQEDYAMLAEQEEEFVHEAQWGAGKEQGVGEEVENDME